MAKDEEIHVRLDTLRKKQLERLIKKLGGNISSVVRQAISKLAALENCE
jgi:hypothetical protein